MCLCVKYCPENYRNISGLENFFENYVPFYHPKMLLTKEHISLKVFHEDYLQVVKTIQVETLLQKELGEALNSKDKEDLLEETIKKLTSFITSTHSLRLEHFPRLPTVYCDLIELKRISYLRRITNNLHETSKRVIN